MIKILKESSTPENISRSQLIDYIDRNYNLARGDDLQSFFNTTIEKIAGIDDIDDSDYEEGLYKNFSDSQLIEIAHILDKYKSEHYTSVVMIGSESSRSNSSSIKETMTVGELVNLLSKFDKDSKVVALRDTDYIEPITYSTVSIEPIKLY